MSSESQVTCVSLMHYACLASYQYLYQYLYQETAHSGTDQRSKVSIARSTRDRTGDARGCKQRFGRRTSTIHMTTVLTQLTVPSYYSFELSYIRTDLHWAVSRLQKTWQHLSHLVAWRVHPWSIVCRAVTSDLTT